MTKNILSQAGRWNGVFKSSFLSNGPMTLRYYMLQTVEQLKSRQMDAKEEFFSMLEDKLNLPLEEALNILRTPKYQRILEDSSWELIPRLCDYITEKNRLKNQQIYNNSADLLLEISKVANPEDVLFEFIEQTEKESDNCSFFITLKAIKNLLLRLPQRRGVAIGWCCNAIIRYLSELSILPKTKLEGEEQLLLENDPQFQAVEDIYLEVLKFLLPFVMEIESNECPVPEKHMDIYKNTLLKTLLKLLGYPLFCTHLEYKTNKSAFRDIAENILKLVVSFHVDLFCFLDFVDVSESNISPVECEFNNSSLGVLYYLILVEGIYIEKVPCVYSNVFLLRQLMWLCMSLLKVDDVEVQWKGLSLAENALNRINDKEIFFEEANRSQCREFAELCTEIMIYSDSKRNREKAVTIFCKFLRMFDPRGRYYMLLSVQDIVKEPGFIGFLATRSKDFIAEALSNRNFQELKYFTGKCLKDLIKKFCRLEDDVETDLTRHTDQIIPCLNLLRYLVIRDNDNCTGIMDIIPLLNNSYFIPLKKAVEVSRAHYILQKNEMSQPSQLVGRKAFSTSVTVGEFELPELSAEQKLQVLDRALNMFDLIDSLLSRVIECIHERK